MKIICSCLTATLESLAHQIEDQGHRPRSHRGKRHFPLLVALLCVILSPLTAVSNDFDMTLGNGEGAFTSSTPSSSTEVSAGSGSAINPPTVAVSISAGSASLAVGACQRFTATVTGTSNTAVTWSVNGIIRGNSTVGMVTTGGFYTAPASAPSPNHVSVTATSQADTTISASARVTIRQQVLGVSASPAQGMSATHALDLVLRAGARGQCVSLHWRDLEPSPGVYDFTSANPINLIQSRGHFVIHVAMGVVNVMNREVPQDLALAPFDSAEMKERFQNMLSAFLTQFGSKIDSITIGNEVDVYLEAHPTEWTAYHSFYAEAAALVHANSTNPDIQVGVVTTFGGATTLPTMTLVADLIADPATDVMMLNYYAVNPDFTPRDANVSDDFAKMRAASFGKPILLQEVGFPTSTVLGSSEQLQAQLFTDVFSEWMKLGNKIEYLNFFLMHDATPQVCQQIANQFGQSDPNFVAFFCSLGLRNSDGPDKQSWSTVKGLAQKNGFAPQY